MNVTHYFRSAMPGKKEKPETRPQRGKMKKNQTFSGVFQQRCSRTPEIRFAKRELYQTPAPSLCAVCH